MGPPVRIPLAPAASQSELCIGRQSAEPPLTLPVPGASMSSPSRCRGSKRARPRGQWHAAGRFALNPIRGCDCGLGCGAFRLYGLAVDTTATAAGALATFDAWSWRVTTVGAVVSLVSALSLMLATTANMAGSAGAALDPDTIGKVLFGTGFGRAWCWHLSFATLTIGACFAPNPRWRMPAILVLALLLLLSLGWVGRQSSSIRPIRRCIYSPQDFGLGACSH